jgi:CRP/FNR family cyclic AMP-dependent transcriptional regulator
MTGPWPPGTLLAALDPAERAALLALGTRRTYRAGAALMHQGSADAATFALLSGYAKVVGTAADGRTVLLSIRAGGDLVGELAALDDRPRSASVVAATRVVAQAVSQQAFLRYLEERPTAARTIHGAVVAELRRATSHRVHMNGAPTAVRLALVLNDLMTSYGRPCADGVRIEVPLSQPELASLVGVSEPTLHRSLTELRARDIVRTRYRHLIVTDPGALQARDSA